MPRKLLVEAAAGVPVVGLVVPVVGLLVPGVLLILLLLR